MKPSIIQSAEDNWPEDEAYLQAEHLKGLQEDYPEDTEDNLRRFRADCQRMIDRVFSCESDACNLIARFKAEILKLTGHSI